MRIVDVRVLGSIGGQTLVEVAGDAGAVGIGLTQAPESVIRAVIETAPANLRSVIIGEDPVEAPRLFGAMLREWGAAYGRGSEAGLAVNAAAALDLAIWDLAGKALGRPIWQLLGGAAQPDGVPAYASSSLYRSSSYEGGHRPWVRKDPDELAAESRTYVEQGFTAIKFGWGVLRAGDEARLTAIRAAIGPDVRLMLDLGNPAYLEPHWDVAGAVAAARVLERYGVWFWEEPLQPHDVSGFGALSAAVDLRIATGESLTRTHEFETLIDARAVDVVQPDAAQIGITQLVDVARRADRAGLLCVPHSPWSAIAVAAHLAVLATVACGALVEYPAYASFEPGSQTGAVTAFLNQELVEHPIELVGGVLQLPDRPGLGLGDLTDAARRRAADGEAHRWQ